MHICAYTPFHVVWWFRCSLSAAITLSALAVVYPPVTSVKPLFRICLDTRKFVVALVEPRRLPSLLHESGRLPLLLCEQGRLRSLLRSSMAGCGRCASQAIAVAHTSV